MNKKLFFILTIIHLNIFCISAQIYPVRPQLSDKHSFSMILLPDPQSYNKFDANQPLFELQTAWIANSIEPLNIKGVLCTGDLVEQNEIRIPDGINGNQTSEEQWQAASRAFERLDDKISYVVCTGNHDYGYEKAENRLCHLPDYFPSERNSCWKKSLVETGLNYQGIPTLENAAYEFETDTWGKLLVISLEFAPRDEAIEWAAKVAGKAKYKNHKVILLTHSYMSPEAKRHIKESYKISPANYGEAIWQKLVYPSSNISMVICGHECEIADYKGNVSFRTDKNSTGKNVAQMMFNAQTADGQWHGNGGDCWLRIMEFMPDGKTIKIMSSAQDHKRAKDGDKGLNTGGMGTFSPSPFYTDEVQKFCEEKVYQPTMDAMKKEGRDFVGILFVGLMLTEDGPKVLEYNARFGDPEAQVVLPRMKNGIIDVMNACIDGKLDEIDLQFEDNAAVCVVLASDGYPEHYEKGKVITGFEKFDGKDGYYVFHAGTKLTDEGIVTNGGRVLGVTAKGKDLKEARKNAYEATNWIDFSNKYMRHDIGKAIDEA